MFINDEFVMIAYISVLFFKAVDVLVSSGKHLLRIKC